MPTPFVPIPREGKLEYEPLSVTFRVSEYDVGSNLQALLSKINPLDDAGMPIQIGLKGVNQIIAAIQFDVNRVSQPLLSEGLNRVLDLFANCGVVSIPNQDMEGHRR